MKNDSKDSKTNNPNPKNKKKKKTGQHKLEVTLESLFNDVGKILNERPLRSERIAEAIKLYGDIQQKAEAANNQIIFISCEAAIGDAFMLSAYYKAHQELYDEVFSDYFAGIQKQLRAIHMADEKYFQTLDGDNIIENEYSNLSSAIHMSVSHALKVVDDTKRLLQRRRENLQKKLDEMLDARDRAKERIGEERWKRSAGKSQYTIDREEVEEKISALSTLQSKIESANKELNQLTSFVDRKDDKDGPNNTSAMPSSINTATAVSASQSAPPLANVKAPDSSTNAITVQTAALTTTSLQNSSAVSHIVIEAISAAVAVNGSQVATIMQKEAGNTTSVL